MNRCIRHGLILLSLATLGAAGCGKSSERVDLEDPLRTLAMLQAEQQQHATEKFMEVDLGEFFIVKKQTDSAYGLGISCHLFGVIAKDDRVKFDAILAQRQQRMRDSVIVLIQSTEADLLVASDLELMKVDLLKTCRQALRSHLLQRVVISEFSVEQH